MNAHMLVLQLPLMTIMVVTLNAALIKLNRNFRSFNAIFSKVGRCASEKVFLSLFCAKCVPILLYAGEACPVNKRTKQSFDFSINRIFMKLFRTGSVALVEDCHRFLNFLPASYQVFVKTVKFLQKYKALENRICSLFGQEADRQLRNLCTAYNLPSGSSVSKIINQIRSKFLKMSITMYK